MVSKVDVTLMDEGNEACKNSNYRITNSSWDWHYFELGITSLRCQSSTQINLEVFDSSGFTFSQLQLKDSSMI